MVPAKRSGFPVIKKSGNLSFFATFLPSPVSNMRIPPKAVSMAVPDAGGKKGVAPLNKGLSRSDWGLRWEGPSGPHRNVSVTDSGHK